MWHRIAAVPDSKVHAICRAAGGSVFELLWTSNAAFYEK